MHDRPARFVENHDGDTITVTLDQGFHDTKTLNLRLANVWAPEIGEPGSEETKAYADFLMIAQKEEWPFIVTTHVTKNTTEVMSFSRYVADVVRVSDGASINSLIMKFITDHNYGGGIGSIARKKEETT